MTLLAEDPALWDTVFTEPRERLQFLRRLIARSGNDVLDVGCGTGTLCARLRSYGIHATGVDINPTFIDAARAKDPEGRYVVADMRELQMCRTFDVVLCLGTTFAYNLANEAVAATVRGFHRHVRPGGVLIVDVLNAIAFAGPTKFRARTHHVFTVAGSRLTATIAHGLRLRDQLMSEQVTWRGSRDGRVWRRQDPEEWLRLYFPQELAFFLSQAGFSKVELTDGFGRGRSDFGGRRLVACAIK